MELERGRKMTSVVDLKGLLNIKLSEMYSKSVLTSCSPTCKNMCKMSLNFIYMCHDLCQLPSESCGFHQQNCNCSPHI